MKIDVVNMKGKKVSSLELPERIFGAPVNVDLMHQAYSRQTANARLGTHSTKSRGEVRGGGKKPWRQKGTGRARQGTIRAPQWVGGGKVHTPRPRSYTQRMPRKMRRAALRSALSAKMAEEQIVIVEDLVLSEPKTSELASVLKSLTGEGSVLVLIPNKDDNYLVIQRAASNLPEAKTLLANYLNIRDLLGYDQMVMPVAALEVIQGYLG